MSECKRCGKCCECIVLNRDPDQIRDMASREVRHSNFNFAYRNFIPITQEQAYQINPYLKEWKQSVQYFYTCRRFDKATRTCKVHSARPDTCSGFPWYGRKPIMQSLYSPECGYQEDLKNLEKQEELNKKGSGIMMQTLKKALRMDN
jgi:Fe-S-cluster containining protein